VIAMSSRHHSQKKRAAEEKAIKIALTVGILVIILAITAWVLYPADLDFEDCTSDTPLQCGCPTNKSGVSGKKSIVLIDATDKIPDSRTQDINEIMVALSEPSSFFDTIIGGYERISAFVFSDKKPDEMKPVASFCKPPNRFILSLKYSEADINKQQKMIKKIADKAALTSNASQNGNSTRLMEVIGIISGSGAYFNKSGKFILFSDLVERSNECGYFDIVVPNFQNISPKCNYFVTRASENMMGSKVYICMIPRSQQSSRIEIIPFWQEYFQTVTGRPAINTCDPSAIMGDIN